MQSSAATVDDYIASLPEERAKVVQAIRDLVREHLPEGYEEGMDFGMIGYYVPLSVFPDTYNKHPLGIVAIAAQKNYFSIYLTNIYGSEEHETWFRESFAKAGKKLDMGKSCVRFKKLEDLSLETIGEAVARTTPEQLIEMYRKARPARAARK